MKVLVTGGSGFLGSRVIGRAVNAGFHVVGIARTPESARRIESLGAETVAADLEKPETLTAAFDTTSPDALLNIASLGVGHVDPLIAAANRSEVKRALFISTATVFSRFAVKAKDVHIAAERSITSSLLDWTILRPTMIYGGIGDRNMIRLLRFLDKTRLVPIPGSGHCLHQPLHVDDLADAVITALSSPSASRKAYDLAGSEPIELREIIKQAAAAMHRNVIVVPVPLAPSVTLVRLYGSIVSSPKIRVDQVQRLGENKTVSIAAAALDLGFAPRSFREGIRGEVAGLRRSASSAVQNRSKRVNQVSED